MSKKLKNNLLAISILFLLFNTINATKLDTVKVVDKDYIMLHFKDGNVDFVDDGLGESAFQGHHSEPENSFAVTYGSPLNLSIIEEISNWLIKSDDDSNYGPSGVSPIAVYRKSKVNGMSPVRWGSSDWVFDYTNEHFIYLKLPTSMEQGKIYTVEINENINSDINSKTITFDILNSPSEAIHTNLVGYLGSSRVKAADLYHFMGDGGNRNYSDFAENEVFIYNVNTEESQSIGSVTFWMKSKTETAHNLTGSDVWNIDFTGFNEPGIYRLAVEGVGCSENFEIKDDIYHDPFKVSILGYFYMRIGQDNLDMTPVPRRPLYIQDQDPSNCKIYVTDMHPWHPNWTTFAPGDKWDRPENWIPYIKAGNPTNPKAIGGHSDALDWDRHIAHSANIYDLCLAYILSDGALDDDDLRIAESGNGIPDILDEAKNEVDFWLNLRYKGGYSNGLTNPDGNNKLYQSDNTAVAAWANALNSSMLAYCFQIAGKNDLKTEYQDSATIAYDYANGLADQMLDKKIYWVRGTDFKMMAAAFLYNLTGEKEYEDIVNSESVVESSISSIYQASSYNQFWGTAAYLLTKRPINYPNLHENMKAAIISEAKSKESSNTEKRPSRRGHSSDQAWWQTSQDMHRTILAHIITENPTDKINFLDALLLEADWGLGRNPLNMIQMTTATTELADKRSVENCYTSGRDDGSPGLHPGHTPYLNIDGWGGVMVGSNPQKVLDKFYPNSSLWPHASKYINTRHIWAHSEFTPRQTMRGKTLLYAYLYSLHKTGATNVDGLIADAGRDQRIIDEDEDGKESVELNGSKSYSSNGEITSYKWILDENEISTNETTTIELELGTYNIILEVKDSDGKCASDTVKVEIFEPISNDDATYDFETADQLDDWIAANLGEGIPPTASISSVQARSGSNSAKLTGEFVVNSGHVLKRSGALEDDIETIVYYVWIPQEMVDSSKAAAAIDSASAGGIQNYLMHTGWDWRSEWNNLFDMNGDAWNMISFNVPEDVISSEIKETGLTCTAQNAAVGQSTIYIDDVIYKIALPPADYDFETPSQFDEWMATNLGSEGGSPIASHSSEVANSGKFSYEIEGNFIAGSENALRKDTPLDDDVVSLIYHVWIPQEIIDSSIAAYNRDSAQVAIIQNFLMYAGWNWISEVYNFHELNGNDWNMVELKIPDEVIKSAVQAIGVSFKMIGVSVGESRVFIDDIYFSKTDDPTDVNNISAIPSEYSLFNNYPNPFNPSTKIKFNLPKTSKVKLNIYDIVGRKVKTLLDEIKNPGSYEVVFDASDLASGMYIYTIKAGSFQSSNKMMLLK